MTWQMKQFIHCWHAQNFENKKQWCDFKAENKTIHSYQLIWLHKIWKDNGLWYIWEFEQVQKTKLQPRCTQNCAVANLAEPMLLSSTVNIYKPSQCSKIQQRIDQLDNVISKWTLIAIIYHCVSGQIRMRVSKFFGNFQIAKIMVPLHVLVSNQSMHWKG